MMAPEYYRRARDQAPIHAQVHIGKADFREGSVRITGRYGRVFRGFWAGAWPGRTIGFAIPLVDPRLDDLPVLDGTMRYTCEYFAGARWIEAYLDREGDGHAIAGGKVVVIDGPTFRPAF